MAQVTPMMQHYLQTKEEYKDCILFYRLGDFYEMFYEDAKIVSKELELTLTGKSCGTKERAPMCGIPYHAAETYLTRLVAKGYKVAICEQMEDPKQAKGMVKREVVRIVTPGTNLNTQVLDETKNNYLMSIFHSSDQYGIAVVDVTTGDFLVTQVKDDRGLMDEIHKFQPSEIVCNDSFFISGIDQDDLKNRMGIAITGLDAYYFDSAVSGRKLCDHFHVKTLEGLGLTDFPEGTTAAGAVLMYLYETQKNSLEHLTAIKPYLSSDYMLLDSSTRRNLELTETLREKQKRGTLLWVLDKTRTAMGARLLRSYIEQPLLKASAIKKRLDAVQAFVENVITREEIREYLNPVYDLERLISRISYKTANPRDLVAFQSSLSMLPHIKYLLSGIDSEEVQQLYVDLDPLEDLCSLISSAIMEEPALTLKEGGIIREGYDEEVDRLRHAKTDGKSWLAQLEAKEREQTGIKNLKIKFNKVFGYYFDVTNSYLNLVPESWTRKQTLTGSERYTTPELKEMEDTILGAEDKLYSLEYDLFCKIRDQIASQVLRIQRTAHAVAGIDVYVSLAVVAEQNHYVRPEVSDSGVIDIKDGRHPVVEKMIQNDLFVSNDTYLDNQKNRVSIITGPNMAGKSTYMRQTALIVLMAQIGSFVPASAAKIGTVDRIFTRVGASDDLASGQSTFMVEMTEVANILRNATKHSLLILDEIGRGTSTFDGLSIAWAVVEHISNAKLLGAKTLFATHYHELTELEGKIESVHNYCIAVKEQGDDIVFLRKIVAGGADKSYGIQVARLAGVPEPVLKRAREISDELTQHDITAVMKGMPAKSGAEGGPSHRKREKEECGNQLSLFNGGMDYPGLDMGDIIGEISKLNVNRMTPMDALNKLYELQEQIKARQ
ncbi:MAG: DNA mismatch repair protein MutS [Clostridiales bacterium]|nr:DNA mismatch repair protein MutS [Clostridiales bacterium]